MASPRQLAMLGCHMRCMTLNLIGGGGGGGQWSGLTAQPDALYEAKGSGSCA